MNKINFSIDSLLGLDTNELNDDYEKVDRCSGGPDDSVGGGGGGGLNRGPGNGLFSGLGGLNSVGSVLGGGISGRRPLSSPTSTVKSEESQMSQASDGSQGDTSSIGSVLASVGCPLSTASTSTITSTSSSLMMMSGSISPSGSPNSSSSSVASGSKSKGPFCAKCKLHSEYYPVKNHKDKCKRRYCNCYICKLIDEGKSLRGKKKVKMLEANAMQHHLPKDSDSRSSSIMFRRTQEDILDFAANFKSQLKRFIFQELGPEEMKMEKLITSILYLLLQRNEFDASILKRKLLTAKVTIEEMRRARNNSHNSIGLNSYLGESSEMVPLSSPLGERLNGRSPSSSSRLLSTSSSSSTVSTPLSPGSHLTCLNSPPNTVIMSAAAAAASVPSRAFAAAAAAAAATSLLSITGAAAATSSTTGEYHHHHHHHHPSSASSSTASPVVPSLPQSTQSGLFSSPLFCPSYYPPLTTSSLSASAASPYQTVLSCPAILHHEREHHHHHFHPNHHMAVTTAPSLVSGNNNNDNSIKSNPASSNNNNHNHLHHHHQHATTLYSFLGSNSGAINLSKRLN